MAGRPSKPGSIATFNGTSSFEGASNAPSIAAQQTKTTPQRSPPPPPPRAKRRQSHARAVKTPDKVAPSPFVPPYAMSAAELDKRRNKLSYRRINVACTHCRRRKIRCIPSPDDPQQRCTTCIRLKKECNFQGVDEAAPSADNADSASSGFVGPDPGTSSTVSSSPGCISEASVDGIHHGPGNGYLSHGPDGRHFHGIPVEPSHHPLSARADSMLSSSFTYGQGPSDEPSHSWDDGTHLLSSIDEHPHHAGWPTTALDDGPHHQHQHPLTSYGAVQNAPAFVYAPEEGFDDPWLAHRHQHHASQHGPTLSRSASMPLSAPLHPHHQQQQLASAYPYDSLHGGYAPVSYPPHSLAVQSASGTEALSQGPFGLVDPMHWPHQQHPHQQQQILQQQQQHDPRHHEPFTVYGADDPLALPDEHGRHPSELRQPC